MSKLRRIQSSLVILDTASDEDVYGLVLYHVARPSGLEDVSGSHHRFNWKGITYHRDEFLPAVQPQRLQTGCQQIQSRAKPPGIIFCQNNNSAASPLLSMLVERQVILLHLPHRIILHSQALMSFLPRSGDWSKA